MTPFGSCIKRNQACIQTSLGLHEGRGMGRGGLGGGGGGQAAKSGVPPITLDLFACLYSHNMSIAPVFVLLCTLIQAKPALHCDVCVSLRVYGLGFGV